ncbi:unnamed protein product [Moneuplotes crassus]|uniref:Uncharacterized protein n=1 Tax=Euplotes crassus TaxID=5936 RepID=A0AAD1X538_EUPCR|nr:unnamed protein product [Moneuplotes crassus]
MISTKNRIEVQETDDMCDVHDEGLVMVNSLGPVKECHCSVLLSDKGSIRSEEVDGFMEELGEEFTKRQRLSQQFDEFKFQIKDGMEPGSICKPRFVKKYPLLRKVKTRKVSKYGQSQLKNRKSTAGTISISSPHKPRMLDTTKKSSHKPIIEPLITMSGVEPGT